MARDEARTAGIRSACSGRPRVRVRVKDKLEAQDEAGLREEDDHGRRQRDGLVGLHGERPHVCGQEPTYAGATEGCTVEWARWCAQEVGQRGTYRTGPAPPSRTTT